VKEEPITNQSDIFSLGCVLYELLTGEQAFPGDNYFSIMYKIINEDPLPVNQRRPEVPEIMDKITRKALSKDPGKRYRRAWIWHMTLCRLRGMKKETVREDKVEDVIDYTHNIQFFNNFTKAQVKEILDAAHVYQGLQGNGNRNGRGD
jgi:serine/threonine-protein kinase